MEQKTLQSPNWQPNPTKNRTSSVWVNDMPFKESSKLGGQGPMATGQVIYTWRKTYSRRKCLQLRRDNRSLWLPSRSRSRPQSKEPTDTPSRTRSVRALSALFIRHAINAPYRSSPSSGSTKTRNIKTENCRSSRLSIIRTLSEWRIAFTLMRTIRSTWMSLWTISTWICTNLFKNTVGKGQKCQDWKLRCLPSRCLGVCFIWIRSVSRIGTSNLKTSWLKTQISSLSCAISGLPNNFDQDSQTSLIFARDVTELLS